MSLPDTDRRHSMLAEAPERAIQFETEAWGHSSDEYEVDTWRDAGNVMVGCNVQRRRGSPKFEQPLQRHEVSGLLDALNEDAGQLGGDGIGPWMPDRANMNFVVRWSRIFTFSLEKPPVDISQPLVFA